MLKKDVINFFGGVTATARALGISKSTVSIWKPEIPWKYALLIEKITQGTLKANVAIERLKN
ncbi:TPA: Cro/CI family transcriptional regulator [Proteus mirabilis]|uniref:Cro/CI family transcriptional regulator n=1 Tax=Proteus TaxID=583 RepID=UPI000657AACC|nr:MULTISPECIES: Cro/CI family transcriptional regulator [Proteus]MBG2743608.1 helix-turn-helix domain-containing protein [Proteus mirabilis]MBG3129626.1 helix-turn-helix domain-containing protein [Proteus mirabilis]MDF7209576.1 Cro/CI family transcriptional regulator [Proteus mirabilis]CRL63900.1 DNA-binding transcriptional regulator DicC [Proteus vulgaris]HEK2942378.1 helix-turn-helix domain-containing protein [Proteus mirabilis]